MSDSTNTESQFRALYRQFLFRVVDLEILSASAQGDSNKLLGQFATLLVSASVFLGLAPLFIDRNIAPSAFLDLRLRTEHQLIAMTMLAVGLFAVLSWDSIFPNRRDVMVLTPLPVRVRTMFLVKGAATATALGLVVVLLHCVTGVTWPLTFALLPRTGRGLFGAVQWFLAYWFTMFASGAFIYCGVLAVQGLTAQFLPRRLFLRVSVLSQIVAFGVFASMYLLERPVSWFQALLDQLAGPMNSAPVPLARRAWISLGVAVVAAVTAYALSYARTVRQIVEEPDITPASHRFRWLPQFGNPVETAIGQFTVRTLARSRQHRLILAFYLGIGAALTVPLLSLLASSQAPGGPLIEISHQANGPMLAASVMMLALMVIGLRVAFALPLELRANWVFRSVGLIDASQTLTAVRRALILLSVVPVWLGSAAMCLWLWPWRQAAGHLAVLGLLGMILVDLALYSFRKIPFTCSYLPGKSQVHLVVCAAAILILLVGQSVVWEQEALQNRGMIALTIALLGIVAIATKWRATALARFDEEGLQFEEEGTPAILELGLFRDGGVLGSRPSDPPST
ncbi:MAG TPA: hypothetical protein VMI32_16415 [Candidatus Solibacter sp.]|nr:hypothetical protein [Candidatus Solibacter sp.]